MKKISCIKNEKGFTIVEILVAIFIIGLLVAILQPNLSSFTNKSQVGVVETDIRLLKSNIQEHFVDNPTEVLTEERLKEYFGTSVSLLSSVSADPLIFELPEKKDPWGQPYNVLVGKAEMFVAFHSFGPDAVNNIQSGLSSSNLGDDILALYYPQP